MKKILHVTRNFPPLMGGMEKLNLHIYMSLSSCNDVSISGPKGSARFHDASNYTEFSHAPIWCYLTSSLFKTVKLAIKIKPDIVFCGSGAAILAGYISAKLTGARLVCYLHGLDVIAKSKVYQYFFIPLIKKSHLLLVNSQHTQSLIHKAGFDSQIVKILFPGTSIPNNYERELLANKFKKTYGLTDKKILLIVGRITKRKGIEEFIVNVMPNLLLQNSDLKLIIIGEEAKQAIKYQNDVVNNISHRIHALGLQQSISMLGGVDDDMLSAAFFSAQLLVFPVLNLPGDVEGFGMVAVEAAAHGVPTVGFNVGGVSDAISDGVSGWLVNPGDYKKMAEVINARVNGGNLNEITSDSCTRFASQFEWGKFASRLNTYLQEL